MNLYFAFGLALIVGAIAGYTGYDYGSSKELAIAATARVELDAKLARQKAEAADALKLANLDLQKTMEERDRFKNQVGGKRETDRTKTDDISNQLSGVGLFIPTTSGCGDSSDSTKSASADGTSVPGPAFIQLPDPATRDLRQLTKDADKLKDDYAWCVGYARGVK